MIILYFEGGVKVTVDLIYIEDVEGGGENKTFVGKYFEHPYTFVCAFYMQR